MIRVPAALPLPPSAPHNKATAEPRRPASARDNKPALDPPRCFLTLLRFSVPESTTFLDEFAAPTFHKNGEGTHLTPHGSSGEMASTAGPRGAESATHACAVGQLPSQHARRRRSYSHFRAPNLRSREIHWPRPTISCQSLNGLISGSYVFVEKASPQLISVLLPQPLRA